MGRIKDQHLKEADRQRLGIALGELAERHGVDVFCWCNRCGHNAVVSVGFLIDRLGPDVRVPEIGVHLRCSACGAKDVAARPAWPTPGVVSRHQRG